MGRVVTAMEKLNGTVTILALYIYSIIILLLYLLFIMLSNSHPSTHSGKVPSYLSQEIHEGSVNRFTKTS